MPPAAVGLDALAHAAAADTDDEDAPPSKKVKTERTTMADLDYHLTRTSHEDMDEVDEHETGVL
jgi:hypothetical protein